MILKHKQRGVTPIGVLLIIIVAGFCVMCVVKVMPLYQDYYVAKGIVEDLQKEPSIGTMSANNIKAMILSRLSVNTVRSLSEDAFAVEVDDDLITIEISYEARSALMYNLDVVAKFDHVVEIDRSGK